MLQMNKKFKIFTMDRVFYDKNLGMKNFAKFELNFEIFEKFVLKLSIFERRYLVCDMIK